MLKGSEIKKNSLKRDMNNF